MKYKTEGDIKTAINILGRFCGKRDISAQVREATPLFASKETN